MQSLKLRSTVQAYARGVLLPVLAGLALIVTLLLPAFTPSMRLVAAAAGPVLQSADWLQWGGPQRNFIAPAAGLAHSWPESGPRRLWSRPLGDGHSMILAEGNRLYTMYGSGNREYVVAVDADNGNTVWAKSYPISTSGMDLQFGRGPHSTPLIAGDLIYTISTEAKLFALDKRDGRTVWSHDLWQEYKGTFQDRGYSCSPLAWQNKLIVTVGGSGQALMAFDLKTGAVIWRRQDFAVSPTSPVIINVDGQHQLIAFLADHIVGLNPDNGDLLWSHEHKCDYGLNITPPVWGSDNILFMSSAYSGGSRALELRQAGGKTTVKELWASRRMRVHHGTIIRVGDLAIGSSGDFGPAPVTAVNVRTGQIVWQDRSFPKANFLQADGRLVVLDEDGDLGLVTVSDQGMKVLARAGLMTGRAWTAPTLVGTRLYLRDRKTMLACDMK